MQNFPFLHDIAVVAIVKNEGNYIKEWLDYHLLAGVTKFYIYDNDSNDNTREILRPYAESGAVQYIPFGGGNAQNPAYMDAIARHRFDFSAKSALSTATSLFCPAEGRTYLRRWQSFSANSPWRRRGR